MASTNITPSVANETTDIHNFALTGYQDFPGFSDSERLSSWTLCSANTIDNICPWHVAIGSYVVHNIQNCEQLDSSPFYIFTPAIDD